MISCPNPLLSDTGTERNGTPKIDDVSPSGAPTVPVGGGGGGGGGHGLRTDQPRHLHVPESKVLHSHSDTDGDEAPDEA